MVVCAVSRIPLPGISLSGFASGHAAEWFHRRTEKLWYQSQLLTLHRVSRDVYMKRIYPYHFLAGDIPVFILLFMSEITEGCA